MIFKRKTGLLIVLLFFVFFSVTALAGDNPAVTGGAQLLNDRSGQIIGADLLSSPGFIAPAGLTGYGQVVAVADSGIDKGSMEDVHPDLAGQPGKKPKIIMLKSWAGRQLADDPVGHGTHMVGTIAGNGSASGGKFKGIAPGVSIYFQGILDQNGKITPPADIDRLFMPAYQAGAKIHVDAWGSGENRYSGTAMEADAFMRKYPDFLAIFGAGNSGPGAGSLTSEANSKNALVVGASVSPRPALDFSSGDTMDTAQFSSRGTAGDGRIKPDLLAPGTSIISTRSSLVKGNLPGYPMYTRMQGSSMGSAVAAGSAALLREYMQRYMSIPDPRSASIKAALINGARTPEAGPSGAGFGVLDLAGTVLALKEKNMVLTEDNAGLAQGEARTYKIRVEDSSSPLKVTVAWTDPAAELMAKRALVNNLDLAVTAPNGKKYYGNSFLSGSQDTVNNVEQVYLSNPPSGEYVIEVRGAAITQAAVRTAIVPSQDYALVYGQPLETDMIKSVRGGVINLYGGQQVNQTGKNTRYWLNGSKTSSLKPEPGFRVYYNTKSLYIIGRQWVEESARNREGAGGRIWFEMNQDTLEGGYYQAAGGEKGLVVNGTYTGDVESLPQGISLKANLDGITQTLWRLTTTYLSEKGSVSRTEPGEDGTIGVIELYEGRDRYQVSPEATYTYNDSFEKTDPLEMVFGSGNLNGLHKVMPGQQVTLVMTPASKVVNSILVDRSVVSGYVTGVDPAKEQITIGGGAAFHIFSGAGIQKDHVAATLEKISPGDYVVGAIIPETREILGLSVYSNVVYGRVLFTSARDNSVYMNDLYNRFQMFKLSPRTEVRRWGLVTDASTLSSGTWVRVTLSPDQSEVWRMDVAELLEDEQKELAAVESPYLITTDSERYRISDTFTNITKDGLPVTAADLLPGEKVIMVSLLAPAPFNKTPVAVRARSREGAKAPFLAATVREGEGRFVISGYTSGDRLYIWHENGTREDIKVQQEGGAFAHSIKFIENEKAIRLVAVNKHSDAVTGRTVMRSEIAGGKFTDIQDHWAKDAITSIAASGIMAGYGDGTFRPDKPVTGAELEIIRAAVRGFDATSQSAPPGDPKQLVTRAAFIASLKSSYRGAADMPLQDRLIPFRDCGRLPEEELEAIAWAYNRGIIKGRSRELFAPNEPLTRAEIAVVIQKLLSAS